MSRRRRVSISVPISAGAGGVRHAEPCHLALVHEELTSSFTSLVCGLFDTNEDRHAMAYHPIEDRAPDSCLRLLIGQSPSVKTPSNDGLVAKHHRFNEAPSAIARTGVVLNRLILGNTGVRKPPADEAGFRSDRFMSWRRRPASPTHAR